jgi:beta-glucosidase
LQKSENPDSSRGTQLRNNGSALIQYVADRHPNTIVVFNSPGPVNTSFAEHANVTAVLAGYYPGQEFGHAISSVLYGDVNPSGKLPFTLAKNVNDYVDFRYTGPVTYKPVANFTDGSLLDYKYFDKMGIDPRYEFGFGLSYSA